MSRLVYYFDIGNTRLKLWRCRDGQVEGRASLGHDGNPAHVIASLPDLFMERPDAVLGGSVLRDDAMLPFTMACEAKWLLTPEYAHSSLQHSGVINAYGEHSAASLGIDRWLGLLAVSTMSANVCVVDCGTAITLDVLRHDGQHLGGYILPGLDLMADVLMRETGRVRVLASVSSALVLGRSTSEAVLNGGMMAVVSLIERVALEYQVKVVLTGGGAEPVSHLLSIPHAVEPELLLHGLQRYFADAGIR